MTKEDAIKEFTKIKGINKTKAELLYKNGFDSIEKLKKVKTEKKEEKPKEIEVKKEKEKIEPTEEKEEYKVKRKPKLSKELEEKLRIRKQIKDRTPEFLREEWFRYGKIAKTWRKPDGLTSKMRLHKKYRTNVVRVG